MPDIYIYNSSQKDFIRSKWIEFTREIFANDGRNFGIITFPAEAMQDLRLYKDEGFIDWVEVETEASEGIPNYRVTKGNIRCFEKRPSVFKILNQRLINAKVNRDDFCSYIATKYASIVGGSDNTFPVDVINLDFEERLYANNRYPFDATVESIFKFQKRHKQNFSLFLTWPVVEDSDIVEYKNLIDETIAMNLIDPTAINFKESFETKIGSIGKLQYETKSVIGMTKIIIKKASQSLYNLDKNEFYVYGGGTRQRMISLMFNFKYDGRIGSENIIYARDVACSMLDIIDVNTILSNNE